MTAPESCISCRFFLPRTSPAFPEADGMCRRYAPAGPVIGSHTSGYQVFPPMMSGHWCGDYRPTNGPVVGRARLAA